MGLKLRVVLDNAWLLYNEIRNMIVVQTVESDTYRMCLSQIVRGNEQSRYEITFAQSKIKC